jgi:hypothetical protein
MPKLKVAKWPEKGAQRLEIARCRTEIGACLLPSERRARIRLSPKRDVVVVTSRSASLRRSPLRGLPAKSAPKIRRGNFPAHNTLKNHKTGKESHQEIEPAAHMKTPRARGSPSRYIARAQASTASNGRPPAPLPRSTRGARHAARVHRAEPRTAALAQRRGRRTARVGRRLRSPLRTVAA